MRNVDRVAAALDGRGGSNQSWLVGEPYFDPPEELTDAFVRAVQSRSYRYPPHNGLPELRSVLSARHSTEDHQVEPEQIAVTSGAKAGLLALLATLLEPGDELIHPQPCYPAYPAMASRIGALPVAVPENGNGFDGWPEAVASKISPRTRAVVLSSPSNPTGTSLSSSTARALVELCQNRGLRLICDEAYADFHFTHETQVSLSDIDPGRNTVIQLRSASKSWALCSWRVGWLVADASLISEVARNHASLINPASGPAQAALCALPSVSAEYLTVARELVSQRMTELCSALESIELPAPRPDCGFYMWLNVTSLIEAAAASDTVSWCEDIARCHGVGLWPGDDFGGPGFVRLAVTAPSEDQWRPAVQSLTQALSAQG